MPVKRTSQNAPVAANNFRKSITEQFSQSNFINKLDVDLHPQAKGAPEADQRAETTPKTVKAKQDGADQPPKRESGPHYKPVLNPFLLKPPSNGRSKQNTSSEPNDPFLFEKKTRKNKARRSTRNENKDSKAAGKKKNENFRLVMQMREKKRHKRSKVERKESLLPRTSIENGMCPKKPDNQKNVYIQNLNQNILFQKMPSPNNHQGDPTRPKMFMSPQLEHSPRRAPRAPRAKSPKRASGKSPKIRINSRNESKVNSKNHLNRSLEINLLSPITNNKPKRVTLDPTPKNPSRKDTVAQKQAKPKRKRQFRASRQMNSRQNSRSSRFKPAGNKVEMKEMAKTMKTSKKWIQQSHPINLHTLNLARYNQIQNDNEMVSQIKSRIKKFRIKEKNT